jgi:uncharacterized protein GlcG (DUF336 family)
MRKAVLTSLAVSAAILLSAQAHAQAPAAPPAPPAYGEPISVEQAKKAAAAAVAEAKKNNWAMAITIVGPSGDLVYFEKMDNTQYGSIAISQRKARAAAIFRRPTKAFEDRVAQGGPGIAAMTLDGMIASEGGLPILVGGKIIGAIGTSGATGAQDGQAAMAGVNALK